MEQYSGFVYLLVLCTVYTICSATCGQFILDATAGKENKYENADENADYFTYTGQSTNITCSFDCVVSCTKWYLTFSKGGEPVHSIVWQNVGITNGTAANFTGKVDLISHDDVTNTYVLQWIHATWQDLEPDRPYVNWTCKAASDSCLGKDQTKGIEYFKYPELAMYAKGVIMKNVSDLPSGIGTATCSVITNPESQITMLNGNVALSSTSSCIPSSTGREFNCSISSDKVNFNEGYKCIVRYNSPETGVNEEVIPVGCCAEGLFPNLPPIQPGLAVWAIILIVLVVLAVLCGAIGGGYYYMNNRSGSGSSA